MCNTIHKKLKCITLAAISGNMNNGTKALKCFAFSIHWIVIYENLRQIFTHGGGVVVVSTPSRA